jgi:hypothetical protein
VNDSIVCHCRSRGFSGDEMIQEEIFGPVITVQRFSAEAE